MVGFSIFGGSKFRGAPTDDRVLMVIGGSFHHPSFLSLSLSLLFYLRNGRRKADNKKDHEISRCASRAKGRPTSKASRRGARARQFKVTNSAVKGVP